MSFLGKSIIMLMDVHKLFCSLILYFTFFSHLTTLEVVSTAADLVPLQFPLSDVITTADAMPSHLPFHFSVLGYPYSEEIGQVLCVIVT